MNRFAEETRGRGLVADLGCGPGHVARYLSEQGVTIFGIDFSAKMVAVAQSLHPDLDFRVEDMRRLSASDASLAGVVLFYSIVHFDLDRTPASLSGSATGPRSLDFRCRTPENIFAALRSANLAVIEQVYREPYGGVEYPSLRCYLVARAA